MTTFPITEMFAWIVMDPTGEHGVLGVMSPDGMPMQAVHTKREVMERAVFRDCAMEAARATGYRVELKRLVVDETLVTVEPHGPQ